MMAIKYLPIYLTFFLLVFAGCSQGQPGIGQTELSATEFEQKIRETPEAIVLDVRTPGEFAGGHLADAINIDWNGGDFQSRISALDTSSPVFVYCLSGGRSASAAASLRAGGFRRVYELKGGMMGWRAANLPETTGEKSAKLGMTKEQFNALLESEKLVLIDFYADWCIPCRKMKPFLDEISKEHKDKVELVRIDVDANPELCRTMGIEALPTLRLYNKKQLSWSQTGYISKEEIVKKLD